MTDARPNAHPEVPGANLPRTGEGRLSAGELTSAAKERALSHGFDLAAVAPPGLGEAHGRYMEWIERGYAGEMSYLSRNPYVRGDLRRLWPETRAALVVAMQYKPERESPHAEGQGKIARYAHGGDYHKFMKKTPHPRPARFEGTRPRRRGQKLRGYRPPCWSATWPSWPGWAGKGRTRSSSHASWGAISFWAACS